MTSRPVLVTQEVRKLGAFLGEGRSKDDPPDSPTRTICQRAPSGSCLRCDLRTRLHTPDTGSMESFDGTVADRVCTASRGRPRVTHTLDVDGSEGTLIARDLLM